MVSYRVAVAIGQGSIRRLIFIPAGWTGRFEQDLVRGIRSSSGGRPPNPHVRTVQRCGIGRRRRTLQQELGAAARSAARQPVIPCSSGLTPV